MSHALVPKAPSESNLAVLEALLKTYVEMNRMKSCETGEKSHALWHSTAFIQAQIRLIVKAQIGIL